VDFGVLGPLRVNGGDVVLAAKQRVVLAALVLRANRVVPVDSLIDALWDDAPPASARVTVQGYLKGLRRKLGAERIITVTPGYQIIVADGELDLDRFTGLCDQARSAAAEDDWGRAAGELTTALDLWRGEPLADVPSVVLERTEVPRLAELRLRAVELRVEAELWLGRHADIVSELRQLTTAEPIREGFRCQLMLALYRCGRQAEALEVFRDVDRMLRDELGIAPGPALRELHQRILAADPALAVAQRLAAGQRPKPGSEPEAEPEFGDLLRAERAVRGLTQEQLAEAAGLTGRSIRSLEAGVSKPRRNTIALLCSAMDLPRPSQEAMLRSCGFATRRPDDISDDTRGPAQLPRDLPDFVGRAHLLAELRGILLPEPGSGLDDGPPTIISINGLGGIGKTALAVHLAHQVRAAFDDGQLFIDLEGGIGTGRDLDSVLGSMLRDLGVQAARIPAGLASKTALLRSSSMNRRVLFVLDNARDTAQVRPLLPSSPGCAVLVTSRRYLAALDGAVHRSLGPLSADQAQALLTRNDAGAWPVPVEDKDSVARIVDCCAGLPLAVRIAAARLSAPSRPGVAAFAAQLSQAAQRLDGLTAEDLSVRSTLTASVALLDTADPVGYAARAALTFLCGWPGGDAGAECTAVALDIPVTRAQQALGYLVDTSLLESRSPGRYKPHDLVKLLVSEQTPTSEDTLRAVFDWYLHAIDRAVAMFATYFTRPDLPGASPAELPQFASQVDALRWCEEEYDNVQALIRYGAKAGWDARVCRLVILAMPFGEQRLRLAQWIEGHQIGLACARRCGDRLMTGRCISGLAAAYRWTGEFSLALEHSHAALEIFTELGERERVGNALVNHGRISYSAKDYPSAVTAFRNAVDYLRQDGDPVWLAAALNQLGMALSRAGDPAAAVPYQLESIDMASGAGLRHAVAVSLLNLSVSYGLLGKPEEAASAIERAAARADGLGDIVLEAEILRQTGEVLATQRQTERAVTLLRRSLMMMDDVGYPDADDVRRRLDDLAERDKFA
jgi:DNA-binding SARP family transcriptional activator/tetratricopeptide (TPR) repeat protein/transcriptional regulator with XRE-family HTH domain